MANRIINLPETKGQFQVKGIVSGKDKGIFFVEKKAKNNKPFRSVNFDISYNGVNVLDVTLSGMINENVYFSKRAEKGQKPDTVKVAWDDRYTYKREGYTLIGNRIGVKRIINAEGKSVNDKKVLTDYDSCLEIKDNLEDGQSVFVKGKLDYSSYTDDNDNLKRSVKLVPNQVSRCADIDFTSEKYIQQNDFSQTIIFTGIKKEIVDDKPTDRFILTAKIVTYKTIEDMEFIILDTKLANLFRKNLKPYNAIMIWGHITSHTDTEEIDEDQWGDKNTMKIVSKPVVREFVITGADGKSIETELYTEEKIAQAIQAIKNANKAEKDYGEESMSDQWGDVSSFDDEDAAW